MLGTVQCSSVQKLFVSQTPCNDENIQNLVSYTKKRTYTEDVWRQVLRNICIYTYERIRSKRTEKTASSCIITVIKSIRMRSVTTQQAYGIINAHKILVGKPATERPLARLTHRWEDNINMDRRETKCGDVKAIHLVQNRIHQEGGGGLLCIQ